MAAQIRELVRQEAEFRYMCLAAVTTKKAASGKSKVFNQLKKSIRNLRLLTTETESRQTSGPDVFDMAKAAYSGKVKKRARNR